MPHVYSDGVRPPSFHEVRGDRVAGFYAVFSAAHGVRPAGMDIRSFDGAVIVERDGLAYYTMGFGDGGRDGAFKADTVDPAEISFMAATGAVDRRGRFTPDPDQRRAALEGYTIWVFPKVAPAARAKAVYRPAFGEDRELHVDGGPGWGGEAGLPGALGPDGLDAIDRPEDHVVHRVVRADCRHFRSHGWCVHEHHYVYVRAEGAPGGPGAPGGDGMPGGPGGVVSRT